jgi:hypothetical protein
MVEINKVELIMQLVMATQGEWSPDEIIEFFYFIESATAEESPVKGTLSVITNKDKGDE